MKQARSKPQLASALIGAFLTITSLPCVVAMIHDLVVGAGDLTGALVAGTFFIGLGALGIAMFWYGAIRKPDGLAIEGPSERISVEKQVLQVAKNHGGKLTIADLVVETNLSVGEAEHALSELEMQNVATSHVSSSGQLVYEFGGFLTNKNRAIDPLRHSMDEIVLGLGETTDETRAVNESAEVHEAESRKK